MNEQERAALDDATVIKAYPSNSEIDSRFKTSFVNRYYGKANEVI